MLKILYSLALIFIGITSATAQVPDQYYQNYESTPQETQHRIGLEDTLVSIGSKASLTNQNIYEFDFLAVDSQGNLAGYDYQLERIVYFPQHDRTDIRLFGNGNGNGPKEFRYPADVKFDKSGNIWVTDSKASRITRWSPDGELLKTINAGRKYARPASIAICKFKIYTVSEQYLPTGVISVISKEGKAISTFQKVSDRMQRFPAYMSGETTCHNGNMFIAGSYKNYIRKYNSGGTILFSRSVQAFEPNKEPMITKDGRFYSRSDDARRASGDLWVENEKLYVGFSGEQDNWFYYLDVYDIQDGDYVRSYVLNKPVENFAMLDNKVYTVEWDFENEVRRLATYKLPDQ